MTPPSAARPRGLSCVPAMRRALIVAACLAAAACGGAQTTPAHRASAPGAVAGGPAIVDRCAALAGGDPSRMMICLSEHHEAIPDGVGFGACVKGGQGAAEAIECMRSLAR
jgi:hypothetical protein